MSTVLPYVPRRPLPPVAGPGVDWEGLREGMQTYYARRDALEMEARRELQTRTRRRRRRGKTQ